MSKSAKKTIHVVKINDLCLRLVELDNGNFNIERNDRYPRWTENNRQRALERFRSDCCRMVNHNLR